MFCLFLFAAKTTRNNANDFHRNYCFCCIVTEAGLRRWVVPSTFHPALILHFRMVLICGLRMPVHPPQHKTILSISELFLH